MSQGRGGLDQFGRMLDPALLQRVRAWHGHPTLGALLDSLEAQGRRRRFFDLWVEAMVADRLHRADCDLEIEVETPSGRTCDFRVNSGGHHWFLHVKRLDEGGRSGRQLEISPRLRVLEHIQRSLLVRIRWAPGADDQLMQDLVVRASEFLEMARIGDELTVRDESGLEVGAVRVVAPWEGTHVSLAIGLPDGFIDESRRIRRLLDRAYRQFMPREENAVLVVGTRTDERVDFDAALLGATEERWDAHPGSAGRAAVGRAEDGFWSGGSRPESRICGWTHAVPQSAELHIDLHFRDDPAPGSELAAQVARLLGPDSA